MKALAIGGDTAPPTAATTKVTRARKAPVVVLKLRGAASKGATTAESAQTSNSTLSSVMEMAMRASIGGRETPYLRDNTWSVMASRTDGKKTETEKEKKKGKGSRKEVIYTTKDPIVTTDLVYDKEAAAEASYSRVKKMRKRQDDDKGKEKAGRSKRSNTTKDDIPSRPPPFSDQGPGFYDISGYRIGLPNDIHQNDENGGSDTRKEKPACQKSRSGEL